MAVLVEFISITTSAIDNYYDVLLIEKNGKRALSIPIGEYEGQHLALSIDKIEANRPLTFDLLCNILSCSDIKPEYVIIKEFIDGIFYVDICCEKNGEKISFDSRCSDAFNLAVKLSLPIFIEEKVLNDVGFEITSPNTICDQSNEEDDWTIEELQLLLKEVEEQGEKEIADLLREKIKDLENEN